MRRLLLAILIVGALPAVAGCDAPEKMTRNCNAGYYDEESGYYVGKKGL